MSSRNISFSWIIFAYITACSSGLLYLEFCNQPNLLINSFIADLIATAVIFVFSRLFKNSSFYDAYWSVIPPLFLLYWWNTPGNDGQPLRYLFISVVVWFWAMRLTWNWAKHWPGLQHEDWRYELLRKKAPKMEIFTDFFGIHFFPTIQVFLGMLPMYAAVRLSEKSIGILDYLALFTGISAVLIQLISDRQLHQFIATRKDGDIIQHGLWGWSRHPNYFGEFLFWCSLGLFGLAAYPAGWWWEIPGAIAMLCMFLFASIPLMETRSLERRPQYQKIINNISMFIPWPPKKVQRKT